MSEAKVESQTPSLTPFSIDAILTKAKDEEGGGRRQRSPTEGGGGGEDRERGERHQVQGHLGFLPRPNHPHGLPVATPLYVTTPGMEMGMNMSPVDMTSRTLLLRAAESYPSIHSHPATLTKHECEGHPVGISPGTADDSFSDGDSSRLQDTDSTHSKYDSSLTAKSPQFQESNVSSCPEDQYDEDDMIDVESLSSAPGSPAPPTHGYSGAHLGPNKNSGKSP